MDIFEKKKNLGAQLTSSGHGSFKFIGRGLIASDRPVKGGESVNSSGNNIIQG